MAVEKMKALSVSGRINELDSTTEALGKTKFFAPDNALSFYSNSKGFMPVNGSDPYAKPLASLTDSLKLLGFEKELRGLKYPKTAVLPIQDWQKYVERFTASAQNFMERKTKCEDEIRRCGEELARVGHFSWLDINLDDLKKCQFVKTRFGALPVESYTELPQDKADTYVASFPDQPEKLYYWGMYCAPVGQIQKIDQIFSHLGFEPVSLDSCSGTIRSVLKADVSAKQKAAEELVRIANEAKAFWQKERRNFLDVYVWLSEKHTYFSMRKYAYRYGDSFILVGWIPAGQEPSMKKTLDRLKTVSYTLEDAAKPDILSHSPPTTLKNRKLWRPFEYLVSIYGIPSYDELDPTAIVAFTYVLLFGLMFADFGQGLVVVLLGWLLCRKKKYGLGRVMIPCGIASTVIGALFGSCFGFENAFDWLYKGIMRLPSKPISVMDQTNSVIIFAVSLGVAMVILAMLINIFASLKRRHYASGLFGPNGIAGLTFYVSVLVGFGGQLAFGWHIVTPAYVLCLIVAPLIIIMFREVLGGLAEGKPDWKPEHWGDMILQSAFELFEVVLSYLTNTISFVRVGAFMLVHAGMMLVVLSLAGMTGGVGYVLIVVIGNAFVIALEGLLCSVQSLRLEFYEMFSRFYEGSGHPFRPVVAGERA